MVRERAEMRGGMTTGERAPGILRIKEGEIVNEENEVLGLGPK